MPLRKIAEKAVYGFLGWFTSFESVWQTTIVIFAVWGFEIFLPKLDPGHLVFLLVLSLYATFTQNGLGHVNELTSAKVDEALDEIHVAAETLLQLVRNEAVRQEAEATQLDALSAVVDEIRILLADSPDR